MRRLRVRDIMVTDVESVEAEEDISIAAQMMLENKFGCLRVTHGNRLAGILTEADFVRYFADRS
jgi:CBS domain-containing protein